MLVPCESFTCSLDHVRTTQQFTDTLLLFAEGVGGINPISLFFISNITACVQA